MDYPIPVVRVILRNKDSEILFLKRKNTNYGSGKWNLPGGKTGFGLTIEETCKKEIKEETNLNIYDIKLLSYSDSLPVKDKLDKHYITLYFSANFSGEVRLNNESSESRWIKPSELETIKLAFHEEEKVLRDLIFKSLI